MGVQCCMGASMMCSFGAAPSTLVVLPTNKVLATTPAANIMDNKPIVNIPPFGVCMSLANPTVAAATAAALGVLTPHAVRSSHHGPLDRRLTDHPDRQYAHARQQLQADV
jgi:hypothetical protein